MEPSRPRPASADVPHPARGHHRRTPHRITPGEGHTASTPPETPQLWDSGERHLAGALLLVVLDRVGASLACVFGVEAELAPRPPLAEEVPAAVEGDADLVEPGAVARLEVAMTLALVEALLL